MPTAFYPLCKNEAGYFKYLAVTVKARVVVLCVTTALAKGEKAAARWTERRPVVKARRETDAVDNMEGCVKGNVKKEWKEIAKQKNKKKERKGRCRLALSPTIKLILVARSDPVRMYFFFSLSLSFS